MARFEAVCLVGAIRLAQRTGHMNWVHRGFEMLGRPSRSGSSSCEDCACEKLLEVLDKVMRGLGLDSSRECLVRSYACGIMLRRRGAPVALRIGVRPLPFEAHAWLECGGVILGDSPEVRSKYIELL